MKEAQEKAKGPHPIWRGIGCFIIIIVPVLSYVSANLSFDYFLKHGLVPIDLLFTPQLPDWLWSFTPGIAQIVQFLFGRYGIAAIAMLTFVFILIFGGIFSVLYAFMYRAVAPSRYGPTDAPPPKVKVKRYKR